MRWNLTGSEPVYQQIADHFRRAILSGEFEAGHRIPSVRELATQARVNPNTMQRAFTVLEAEQLFITRGTLGRFITTDTEVLARAREVMRRETVARLVEEAAAVGITPEELIEGIRAYEESFPASEAEPTTDTAGEPSPDTPTPKKGVTPHEPKHERRYGRGPYSVAPRGL